MDLADTGRKRAGRFSMGMRQRLGLALALVARPRLLVLDEPTNGLDPIGIEELRDQIRGFAAAGTTVLVSSHILSEVQQMADTIGIIYRGRLAYEDALRPGQDLEELFMDVCREGRRAAQGGGGMTGEKTGLIAGLRAEALKSRHAAPVRLAVPWRCRCRYSARCPTGASSPSARGTTGTRSSCPWRSRSWWRASRRPTRARGCGACWGWASRSGAPGGRRRSGASHSARSRNLVVFGIYLAGSAFSAQGLTAAGTLTMLCCALVNTVTAAWMIPAGLFLTARLGMLAGIFVPLAVQLVGGFAWSVVPLPQLFPPSASMVIPTSFIPVLPSGEPLAADMALGGALAADGALTLAGLAVCALAFAALTAAGAAWFARSEER